MKQGNTCCRFNVCTAKEHETVELSPFTELLTEGFDHDQIWEEIATQNDPMLEYASATVQDFMAWEDDASASGHSLDQDLNDSQNELSDDLDAASVDGDVDMGDDIEEEDNLEDADADEDEDMDMNMDPEADEQEDEDEEDEESEEEAPKRYTSLKQNMLPLVLTARTVAVKSSLRSTTISSTSKSSTNGPRNKNESI